MEKQYQHQSAEEKTRAQWAQDNTYQLNPQSGPLYTIDTPPPTVSGSLHIGHIFSYTQTDIIARYKRMNGFAVYYPFGFDDNGLPTERYVEKKLNIQAHKLSRSEFIKLCLAETKAVEHQFQDLWQRIGLSVDWQYTYSTISDTTRRLSQESFILLYQKGFVYRKNEPALYCTTCRTSVAQAELDDAEKPSFFNDVVFKDASGNDLIVGTTRPELLPAVVALLYHPHDQRYKHLKGQKATVPVFGQQVPIFEDEKVVIDKGTGLVMVSTFGDKTDIEWFKKFKLPYVQTLGFDGIFNEKAGILQGLKVAPARERVLNALSEAGSLVSQRAITHTVNVHERCKKEIEYIMLPQWFLNILDHKKDLVALADKINWWPSYMKSRYVNWVESLGWDWCLSRQRFFGIPFPVWHCTSCQAILTAPLASLPVDPQEMNYSGGSCPSCKGTAFTPDTDVMDTWNTSSITPYIVYGLFTKEYDHVFNTATSSGFMPMSMRPQAHDIIRTWAFYTITKTWMHNKTIPWTDIVISGHVLSGQNEKLSKSKENATLTPQGLLTTYPADAIRYWTASGALGSDISFSESQIKIGLRLITKLWNAFWFTSEHTKMVDPAAEPQQLGTLNEWLLESATQTFNRYQAEFEKNEFSLALDVVEKFFWQTFCDNYLELCKDQLFNPDAYTPEQVTATRWTLHHVGLRILQWYAPFIPYVTETIYQELYRETNVATSLHQTQYQKAQRAYNFPQSVLTMQYILTIVSHVRKLKSEQKLSLKTPLHTLTISDVDTTILDSIRPHEQLIKGVAQAQTIRYEKADHGRIALDNVGENYEAHVIARGQEA